MPCNIYPHSIHRTLDLDKFHVRCNKRKWLILVECGLLWVLRVFVANSLTTACSSTTRTLAVIGSARRRKPTSKSTICKLLSLYLLILLCQIESVIIFNPVFSLSSLLYFYFLFFLWQRVLLPLYTRGRHYWMPKWRLLCVSDGCVYHWFATTISSFIRNVGHRRIGVLMGLAVYNRSVDIEKLFDIKFHGFIFLHLRIDASLSVT